MKIIKCITLCMLSLVLISCARVPMKVDNQTFQKYQKISESQKNINNPLIGTWRVNFASNEKIDDPKDAYYSEGEAIFVSIKRGNSIDFVCVSFLGDYGEMSDQGPSFRVNLDGTTFWSFKGIPEKTIYEGKLNGILGSTGKVEAILSPNGQQLKIHEYPDVIPDRELPEVFTTTKIIGGPIMESLDKGTISTIFLERKSQ